MRSLWSRCKNFRTYIISRPNIQIGCCNVPCWQLMLFRSDCRQRQQEAEKHQKDSDRFRFTCDTTNVLSGGVIHFYRSGQRVIVGSVSLVKGWKGWLKPAFVSRLMHPLMCAISGSRSSFWKERNNFRWVSPIASISIFNSTKEMSKNTAS